MKDFADMTEEELANLTPEQYQKLNEEIAETNRFKEILHHGDGHDEIIIYHANDCSENIHYDGMISALINDENGGRFIYIDKLPKKEIEALRWKKGGKNYYYSPNDMSTFHDEYEELVPILMSKQEDFIQLIKDFINSIGKKYEDFI